MYTDTRAGCSTRTVAYTVSNVSSAFAMWNGIKTIMEYGNEWSIFRFKCIMWYGLVGKMGTVQRLW